MFWEIDIPKFGNFAIPQSATFSKAKLHYKHFSTDLSIFKENIIEKSMNFEMQCILSYSRCIAIHFQLLQLVR